MKYLLLLTHYVISSVWLFLCATVKMENIPKGLFWMVIILLLLIIQGALTGLSMENFQKNGRFINFIIRIPMLMFFFGCILFVVLNYKSTGGRWIFV